MTLPVLAKKVKRLASIQLLNIKLLINGRGLSKFKKVYRLEDEIGQGGFGLVYKAVRVIDNLPVAVKFIERRHVREWGKLNDERVPMEICMLARCSKIANVVRLLDWFTLPEGFFIVMERPNACIDLFDFIHSHGCLTEELARFLFRQVVETTIACMKRKVLHRDIKDENIVIDLQNGETRLVDFGAATILKKTRYHDFQGTRLYCPPEWFLHSVYLGKEATVWSLGVLLYNMLNGKLPFHNEKDICTAHLLGPLPFFTKLSPGARTLIEKCLNFDPYSRPSLEEILNEEWTRLPTADWLELNASTSSCYNYDKINLGRRQQQQKQHQQKQQQNKKINEERNENTKLCGNNNLAFTKKMNNEKDNNNNNSNLNNSCDSSKARSELKEDTESGLDSCGSESCSSNSSMTSKDELMFAEELLEEDDKNKNVLPNEKQLTAVCAKKQQDDFVPRRNAKTSLLKSSPPSAFYNKNEEESEDAASAMKSHAHDNADKEKVSRGLRVLKCKKMKADESFDSGVSSTAASSPSFCLVSPI